MSACRPILLTTLLCLSGQTLAAEALSPQALEGAYIPDNRACPSTGEMAKNKAGQNAECLSAHSPLSTNQLVHDAEQVNTRQQQANPNLNNPGALPPPGQLPPPEITPAQQQIIEQIRQLPGRL